MPLFRLFLLAFFVPLIFPLSAESAAPANHIETISIRSEEDIEKILIQFKKPFKAAISQHFDEGYVNIILPETDYDKEQEILHVNDRFLRIVRLYKEGRNTILEVQFADPQFKAIGKVSSLSSGSVLTILLKKTGTFKEEPAEEVVSFEKKAANEDNLPIPFSGGLSDDANLTVNIVKMLLAVTAILVFFYGVLWVYKKFFVSRFGFKKGDHRIRLLNSFHLSPKQKIVILEVDRTTFACGVTPDNISLIAEVTDPSFYTYLNQIQSTRDGVADFSKIRTQYLESKVAKENDSSSNRKPHFASELLNKVKNLKPID